MSSISSYNNNQVSMTTINDEQVFICEVCKDEICWMGERNNLKDDNVCEECKTASVMKRVKSVGALNMNDADKAWLRYILNKE